MNVHDDRVVSVYNVIFKNDLMLTLASWVQLIVLSDVITLLTFCVPYFDVLYNHCVKRHANIV